LNKQRSLRQRFTAVQPCAVLLVTATLDATVPACAAAAAAAAGRFTQLAHNIREKVTRQPAYLKPPKAGKLREYQMVRRPQCLTFYSLAETCL
jgi:hypothetical protein